LRARAAPAAVFFLAAAFAVGDGGRVRLRQDAGPYAITVFTAPEPLMAGPADVSVLVQDRATGDVVLDAPVEIRLRPPDGVRTFAYATTAGRNRLLRQAAVEVPFAGRWHLEVAVRRGTAEEIVSALLPVEPASSHDASIWPFLAAPPVAVALFALRGARSRRRRREGSRSHPGRRDRP
jgi:hypothetical protein